jgi:hypothetical protein
VRFPSGWLGALAVSMAPAGTVPVSRAEIFDAMKASQGYDLEATANGARRSPKTPVRRARVIDAGRARAGACNAGGRLTAASG